MNNYYFTLADLRAVLRTPHPISISENLQPFLSEAHEAPDCVITLKTMDPLPAFSDHGIWYAAEYHDHLEGVARKFHCEAPHTAPFAVTQFFENATIEICVLPQYMSYLTGTIGIFNRIGLEALLLQHQALLLHASLIKYNNQTLIFAGPSGVGKSTQAELWRTHMGAQILNGDRAVLRKTPQGWNAYGSPCAGTSGIYKNDSAPPAAIVLLRQAKENRLSPLNPAQALPLLYPEFSIHHWDKAFVSKATDLALQLLAQVPVYLLECVPDETAPQLVKKGLGL